MAYSKAELERLSLEAIEKYELLFIEDVIAFLPVGKTTFYQYKMNETNSIKEAIHKVKIEAKAFLRKRWKTEDAPATQIALYKILANDEERDALNNNKESKEDDRSLVLPKGVELVIKSEQ